MHRLACFPPIYSLRDQSLEVPGFKAGHVQFSDGGPHSTGDRAWVDMAS